MDVLSSINNQRCKGPILEQISRTVRCDGYIFGSPVWHFVPFLWLHKVCFTFSSVVLYRIG
jgi:hypothetical protein